MKRFGPVDGAFTSFVADVGTATITATDNFGNEFGFSGDVVASRDAQQRVGLADHMVRRDQYQGPRNQSSERARGILVMCIADDLRRDPPAVSVT